MRKSIEQLNRWYILKSRWWQRGLYSLTAGAVVWGVIALLWPEEFSVTAAIITVLGLSAAAMMPIGPQKNNN